MKGKSVKTVLSVLLGLVLSAAAGAVMGTWGLPEENDLLTAWGPVRLSVAGAGAALSMLTICCFAGGWMAAKEKGKEASWADAVGFGLLPGIAVWKSFEQGTRLGLGTAVTAGLPVLPWVTREGIWLPSRLESVMSLILFAAVILWLMIRKKEWPAGWDLAGVSVTLWCALRLITEGARAAQTGIGGLPPVMGWLAAAGMLLCLILWTVRSVRAHVHPGYFFACWAVWVAAVALIAVMRNGLLTLNHPWADCMAVILAAALAMKAVLCMGRISRG